MATRARKSSKHAENAAVEASLRRLLVRLSRPGIDRWEAETAKVRALLTRDAAQVVERLEARQAEAVSLFSRRRTREPLVELCRTHFSSITFSELARLAPREQAAVIAFHACLDELRWYVGATEDMPSAVQATVAALVRRLGELRQALTAQLGPVEAEGRETVEGSLRHHPAESAGPTG